MNPLVIGGVILGVLTTAVVALASKKPAPTVDPPRSPEIDAQVTRIDSELDIANIGTPQHKVPSAASISGALLYAQQLDTGGYHNLARGIRELVKWSTGQ
jgi:hypothetical protein